MNSSSKFCSANSFLLKVPCRCGSGWLFPEALLFFMDSNAYMTTWTPGCDLHQGETVVCPWRVSCVLLLKKVTLQKCNVLKVKSFPLYPSIHKVENKQAVAPKSSFKYRCNSPSLEPSISSRDAMLTDKSSSALVSWYLEAQQGTILNFRLSDCHQRTVLHLQNWQV